MYVVLKLLLNSVFIRIELSLIDMIDESLWGIICYCFI